MKKNNNYIAITAIIVMSLVAGFIAFNNYSKKVQNIRALLPTYSNADLMTDATLVVRGKVNKLLPSKWSNENFKNGIEIRNILQTDVSIDIEKVLKGTPYDNKNILVRIDKGATNDLKVNSDVDPDFKVGEKVTLFLVKDTSDVANASENYYIVLGGPQGKFLNVKDNTFKNDSSEIDISKIDEDIKNAIKNDKRPKITEQEIKEQNEKVFGK